MARKVRKLKLFVWTGFCPDYSGGLAFAIAKDEQEARGLIDKKMGGPSLSRDWGDVTVYPLGRKHAEYVVGGS